VQIGIITSIGTLVGIGASPFWGYRSHRSKDSLRIVLQLCIVTTLLIVSLVLAKQYVLFLLGYAAFAFFQTPIMPLTDAVTLENRIPFGAVRKWGALGFAAGVFLAGQIAEATSLATIFPLCGFCYAVAWVVMMRLRRDRDKVGTASDCEKRQADIPKKKLHGGYGILFRNKKLIALLISAFFICGTNIANNIYFGFLYKEVGGSIAGIGVAFLLMCSSEAPFMAWTERLEKILTMEKMILISMIISALRYLWYSTGPAPELLIGTFFIQGMVNGIVLVEFVRYVSKLVEPAMIGMALTLYQALSSGSSSILCQFISGVILDYFGGIRVYLFFAVYNMIGILFYVGFKLYKCSD